MNQVVVVQLKTNLSNIDLSALTVERGVIFPRSVVDQENPSLESLYKKADMLAFNVEFNYTAEEDICILDNGASYDLQKRFLFRIS